jgi:glyoxylase-like metal-dependent hydrolase (beta-lactamase superfamily II)
VTTAAADATPRALGDGVSLIDLAFLGHAGAVGAYVVADGDDVALVETGPGSTIDALRAGLAAAGFEPEQLTRVVVTHIHLDHAGAAGAVLRAAPRATFHVHPAGARHMVDPSKLLASATRIYGDDMDRLWGAFEPVPAERVRVLADGDAIDVGRRRLVAVHTPGHAIHHVALHDADTGDVFTGDVAGVRLAGLPYVRPPTPPPDIDLDAWRGSVARLRALRPRRLLLTHFGPYDDPEWHLDELLARLFGWAGWLEARLAAGEAPASIVPALERRGAAEVADAGGRNDAVVGYELATPSHMTVAGIARWLSKRAERRGAGAG